MIIIGELINGTRKAVKEAIARRDDEFIGRLAREQEAAGADYIDCNAGTTGDAEAEDLAWLVAVVQAQVSVPVSLDSPNPAALARALEVYTGERPLINSITAEAERIESMMPIVAESGAAVVALAMGDEGMPADAEERVANGRKLASLLLERGVPADGIFIDPVVVPLGTDHRAGTWVLDAISALRSEFPDCHITGGLSNVSYGLPQRRLLNRVFAVMCVARGLDSAIVDPLDSDLMAALAAAETVAGRDEWCMNYLQAYRDGRLG